jgi:succinoglycan biosynthesis protein ExoM
MIVAGSGKLRIDIGICTYRRPELEVTLRSLFALDVPEHTQVRLIVADNDAEASAQALVERLKAVSPFEIEYVHCPKSNISIARNACLAACQADYLAFIDDDETAGPGWLAALVDRAEATSADAVLGPVRAIYPDNVPAWMRSGDFHSTNPVWVNDRIVTGYTCNVLLDMRSPKLAARKFALSLGQSGGEDTHYFTQLTDAGGQIEFAREALLEEPVPQKRASFSWLAKRRFRSGQTHGRIVAAKSAGLSRIKKAAIAAMKFAYCAVVTVGAVAVPVTRTRYALRAALHAGSVMGTLGMREIRQYGMVEAT